MPGLSPVRAFFLLMGLAGAVALGIFATRDEAAPAESPPAVRTPDFSLTDAEAVAEFERLNAQLMEAYRERDITLAEQIFTSDSPMLPRVRTEIARLVEEGVLSLTRFKAESVEVATNEPDRIVLRRREVLYPRFERETGEDASGTSAPERRTVRWYLHQERGAWLLHNAVVVARDVMRSRS